MLADCCVVSNLGIMPITLAFALPPPPDLQTFLRPWPEGKEQPAEQCCLPQILNDLNKLGVKVVLAEPVKCTLKTLLFAVSSSSFSFSFILLPAEKIYRISPRIELSTAHYVKVKKKVVAAAFILLSPSHL